MHHPCMYLQGFLLAQVVSNSSSGHLPDHVGIVPRFVPELSQFLNPRHLSYPQPRTKCALCSLWEETNTSFYHSVRCMHHQIPGYHTTGRAVAHPPHQGLDHIDRTEQKSKRESLPSHNSSTLVEFTCTEPEAPPIKL